MECGSSATPTPILSLSDFTEPCGPDSPCLSSVVVSRKELEPLPAFAAQRAGQVRFDADEVERKVLPQDSFTDAG